MISLTMLTNTRLQFVALFNKSIINDSYVGDYYAQEMTAEFVWNQVSEKKWKYDNDNNADGYMIPVSLWLYASNETQKVVI